MVVRHAARVIVPSSYLQDKVSKWGIGKEKISVIYNAVDVSSVGTVPEGVKGLPRPHIVTAARLMPWKGVRELIDSMKSAKGSLIIVGEGSERKSLEEHAKKLGGRVLFTGALPHEDTLAAIQDADVFVLNSHYEGLPHVLIEALLLGTPVIATDVGGTAELIMSPSQGTLIPKGNTEALINALSQASTLETPTFNNGEFSVDTMVHKTAELLKTLT